MANKVSREFCLQWREGWQARLLPSHIFLHGFNVARWFKVQPTNQTRGPFNKGKGLGPWIWFCICIPKITMCGPPFQPFLLRQINGSTAEFLSFFHLARGAFEFPFFARSRAT